MRGVCHAFVVYYITMMAFRESGLLDGEWGGNVDHWTLSATAFTSIVFVVNVNLMIYTRFITWLNWFAVGVASIGMYVMYMWISNYLSYSKMHNAILPAHGSEIFYLTVIICVALCASVDYFLHAKQLLLQPSPSDYLR